MIKKILMGFVIVVAVAGVGLSVYFYLGKVDVIKERDALIYKNTELSQSLDAIGPITKAYTVKAQVRPGTEIKPTDLIEMSIPESAVSENTITDLTQLFGNGEELAQNDIVYYKVTLNPGTPLTADLIMHDDLKRPYYERDLVFDFLPVGLQPGDYIDVRVVLPDGETYLAMTHKRVYGIYDKVVKLKLSYGELAVYDTLLTDDVTYASLGFKYYPTKYVEPGVEFNKEPIPFYPVSMKCAQVLMQDPNIADYTSYINDGLRQDIEARLVYYETVNKDSEYAGRKVVDTSGTENGALTSAYAKWQSDLEEKNREASETGEPVEETPENADILGSGNNGELLTDESILTGNDGYVDNQNPDLSTAGDSKQDSTNNTTVAPPTVDTTDPTGILDNVTEEMESVAEDVNDLNDATKETMANVDADGNKSNISQQEKVDSKSDGTSIFDGIDGI